MREDEDLLEPIKAKRGIPRLVGYPMLLVLPVVALVAGIFFGTWPLTMWIALWPNPTPVGNWVLFLIGVGIALFVFFDNALKTGSYRAGLGSSVISVATVMSLLLAGITGLIISTVIVCLLGAIAWIAQGK